VEYLVFLDRFNNAADRPLRLVPATFEVLTHFFVITRQCSYRLFGGQMNDLETTLFQLLEKLRHSFSCCPLNIMEQQYPLAVFLQITLHTSNHFLGPPTFEIKRIQIRGENGDVALAKIIYRLWCIPQIWETKERSTRLAQRQSDGTNRLLDLIFGNFDGRFLGPQVCMRPSVRANRIALIRNPFQNLGLTNREFANGKERCADAVPFKGFQYHYCV
jgi:hypothetical protein